MDNHLYNIAIHVENYHPCFKKVNNMISLCFSEKNQSILTRIEFSRINIGEPLLSCFLSSVIGDLKVVQKRNKL